MKTATLVAVCLLIPISAASQSEVPRTGWGAPDLQGMWTITTMTPLERPPGLEDTPRVAGLAAAAFIGLGKAAINRLLDEQLNADFLDIPETLLDGRTSLVVDPADGRIPRTTAGQRQWDTIGDILTTKVHADGPEDRTLSERCIVGGSLPVNPLFGVRLFQTANHVVIHSEVFHEAIVVPLDGRAHLPQAIRQWNGNSRGYWDGDTLVVETTNFDPRWTFQGSGPDMRLVERFTRVDAVTLDYAFTVHDAASFTRPWSAEFPLTLTDTPAYEMSCHEGNRSMPLMLAGGRADDEARQFVGAFKLVSFVNYAADGTTTAAPYTEGLITYDANRRMSVHLMNPERPRPDGRLSDADRASLYSSYIAYFGAYRVNFTKRVVEHIVDGALSPGLVDTTQVRHYAFEDDGNTLVLSVKRGDRVASQITWERYR